MESISWGDFATWTTAIVATATLFISSKAAIQNKRIEVLLHFFNRYDQIESEKLRIQKEINRNLNSQQHFIFDNLPADIQSALTTLGKRFWSLQYDQFDLWCRGYIDSDTYLYWVTNKKSAVIKHASSQKFSVDKYIHTEGWNDFKNRWNPHINSKSDFVKFMSHAIDNTKGIDVLFREHGPSLWRRLGFN